MQGPTSHTYFSQRLRLHYVDWGNQGAPPMILIHGGRDHCRNWDWVAEHFRDDYHIIAPDLRGHGDSQWMIGGSYNQIDYVYDIAQLLHQKEMSPVTIIGHSLGGSISLLYTALYPENVDKLISIEGMGPPPSMIEDRLNQPMSKRLDNWIKDLRKLSARIVRKYDTLEDAFQRMQTENPHLSEEQARHLTIHGSTQNETVPLAGNLTTTYGPSLPPAFPTRTNGPCSAVSPAQPCWYVDSNPGHRTPPKMAEQRILIVVSKLRHLQTQVTGSTTTNCNPSSNALNNF